MASLTQPLEFRKYLTSQPRPGFDSVPFLDAFLIALFVALNASSFVFLPGTSIELPRSPTFSPSPVNPTAVLTVERNQLFFLEGLKLSPSSLETRLRHFIDKHRQLDSEAEYTLLIKADVSIQTEVLFSLMDVARKAGFNRIHLASEPSNSELSRFLDSEGAGK